MDEEKLERIAAQMRKVSERWDLLCVNERLRIAARQREKSPVA